MPSASRSEPFFEIGPRDPVTVTRVPLACFVVTVIAALALRVALRAWTHRHPQGPIVGCANVHRMSELVGFIGLGVMGKPMARNLLNRGFSLVVHSRSQGPVDELVAAGASRAASAADVARQTIRIVTMLPDGPDVQKVLTGADGVFSAVQPGTILIDMSTIAPGTARSLADEAKSRGASMLDAPVSGGEIGAIDGTLSIMVGGEPALFDRLKPYLACMGTEVTHCGPVGAGEAVKLMNNMVVAQTVVALAEAIAVARASGAVDPRVLFETLTKGSADSFALRNHGMKSLLPDNHPTAGAFPTSYIIKDLSYALALAESAGVTLEQAETTKRLMERTAEAGYRDNYYTAVVRTMTPR